MKKKLIIINGTMGVGKSTVCRRLMEKLENSVLLDGDWCWQMNPFRVTEENKRMVEDNIVYLLSSYLTNSNLEYIIFNWVIPDEDIFDIILDKLSIYNFDLYKISLVCEKESLRTRMKEAGREESEIHRSINRLDLYQDMDTTIIDTTRIQDEETADRVVQLIM